MCSACGFPETVGHWTDAGAVSAADKLRNRFVRLDVINRMLAPYKMVAYDDGSMPGFQLRNASGEVAILKDLEALWQEAERLGGGAVDPLKLPLG
jgi:hypothetical protein